MSNEKKPVHRKKNTEDTRLKLLTAFVQLHQTMRYDEITITAICEKAGVANSTFYYYYDSINEMVADRFEKYVADMEKACENVEMNDVIHEVVESVRKEKEIFLLMADYSTETRAQIYSRCVLPFVQKHVHMQEPLSMFHECVLTTLLSAIVGLLYVWLKEDRPFTSREVEMVITDMIEAAVSQCAVRNTVQQLIF